MKVLPTCTCRNFGLKIELDPLYGRAYVLDVETKSSAAKLFSSLKATRKAIWLSYIVEIANHCIFSKSETTTALAKIRDEGVNYILHLLLNLLSPRSNNVTIQMSLLYLISILSGQGMNCQQMI